MEWESFRAARSALGGVVTAARARDQAATYAAAMPGLQAQLASFLLEGKLKVRSALENASAQLRRHTPSFSLPHAVQAQSQSSVYLKERTSLCGCAVTLWGRAGRVKIQGAAQEEFVLERMTEVFTCLRCCNVALRWLLLHTCSSHKKLRAAVASSVPAMQDLLALLLDTALLEFEVPAPCQHPC